MTTVQSHGLARRRVAAWTLAFSVMLLGGCGGGGSSGSLPLVVPPAPPAPTAQINGSNYLDAAAVGSVGRGRALELAGLLDFSFTLGVSSNFTTANFNCPSGGTVTLTVASVSSNTTAPNNCNLGVALLKSGSIQVSNLEVVVSGTPPRTDLSRGTYRVLDFVTRVLPGDGVDQAYNASVQANRQADASVSLSGSFTVLRSSRTDSYSTLTLSIARPGGQFTSTGATFDIATPRFAIQPLRTVADESATRVLRVSAPDGSNVKVTTVSAASGSTPAQLRFEVFANATTTTPSVTQTLAENDPQVVAAINRALQ
jgi:hypothetical protein